MRENVIHQSLLEKKLLAGIDEKIAMPLWGISFAFAMLYGFVLMLPAALMIHLFFRWVYKSDTEMLEVYIAYSKEADVYDPWPRVNSDIKRPEGFSRDFLC